MKRILCALAITCSLSIGFIGCKKDPKTQDAIGVLQDSIYHLNDSLKIVLRDGIVENLKGAWIIDSLEIHFQNSYYHKQAGISSDTTFLDFGELIFSSWMLTQTDNDSTDFKNECRLRYKNEEFAMSFDYLLYIPLDYKVFSYTRERIENPQDWSSSDAFLLRNLGILDNFQIRKINENEFKMIGLNKGVKSIKLRRK